MSRRTLQSEQLDRMIRTRKQLFEKLSLKEAYAQRPEEFYEYAGTLAYVCYAAVPVLSQKLEEAGMQKLFDEIEMPVSRVLYEMEKEGVLVRRQELQAYGDALVDRINELETKSTKRQAVNLISIRRSSWEKFCLKRWA